MAPEGPGGVLRAAQSGQTAASGIASAISDFLYADLDAKIDPAMADLTHGELVAVGLVTPSTRPRRAVFVAHGYSPEDAADIADVILRADLYGIAGYYVRMAVEQDLLGACMTNSEPILVPTFAARRR